jgi:hypothetical protein
MLKILGLAAAALAVAAAGTVAYAAGRPDTFRVERSTLIAAPPAAVAAHVNDFHAWVAWSPFEKVDPAVKRSYAGPRAGVGAVYAFDGEKVGAGRIQILDATPERTAMSLDFIRPMKTSNTATFLYEPAGQATRVTWRMDGPMPLPAKVMGLFVSMDDLVGKDFEQGLADLKRVSEA